MTERPLALVTGASTGIGYELAKFCAQEGYDLVIAANEPEIANAAETLSSYGVHVKAVETDLATTEGVDEMLAATAGRPIELLLANAGTGEGGEFLNQDFHTVQHIINTNVTGTLYLLHTVAQEMRSRQRGRILITGSIVGFIPGPLNSVYNSSKAFIDSFSYALRNELKDSGVTVTCLMPGGTETPFFERAGMTNTTLGQSKKDNPADVAKTGFAAMMRSDSSVVHGLLNKFQAAAAGIVPQTMLASMHRNLAAPNHKKSRTKQIN